jgi:hypothetical protein
LTIACFVRSRCFSPFSTLTAGIQSHQLNAVDVSSPSSAKRCKIQRSCTH